MSISMKPNDRHTFMAARFQSAQARQEEAELCDGVREDGESVKRGCSESG